MKETFYRKVGRRYEPVWEYDQRLMDALPKGSHLICVFPGGQSIRYNIEPNYAAMIAAGRLAEDRIREALHRASEGRPQKKELTPEQLAAWKNMQESLGDERFYLQFGSIAEAAEAGIKAMQEEADKLMKHPAVRDAWDQFQLVCKLTKEQHNGN